VCRATLSQYRFHAIIVRKGDVMSLLHRVFLPALAIAGLGFLVACSSSSNNSTPPPSGGFSNTNFNGTYTFSISGSDSSGSPLTIAGTVTACGCSNGQISAGTVDIFDISGEFALPATAINASASGYTVNANGTGTLKLNFGTSIPPFQFVFALTDAAHGVISEYDENGTGSGTIDLQPNPVTLATTPYAFSVSGTDGSGDPLAVVGAFTPNSGTISAGIADFNDNATNVAAAQPLSGSIAVGTGTSPGSAALTIGSTTLHFDVYGIDATHLKLIATDGTTEVLVGDVFSQGTAAIPTGSLSFSMAGTNDNFANLFAIGGTMTTTAGSNGSATVTGSEDINVNGTVDGNTGTSTTYTPYPFTGGFTASPSGSGRFQVALSGFQGGVNFAAYPSSGGILMLEVEPAGTLNPGTTSGTAMAQNSPAGLVASQGYGMNLTGTAFESTISGTEAAELDQIAQFNTTGTSTSGELYQNTGGSPANSTFTGTITANSNGTGEFIFNNNSQGVFYYGIDSANSFALGIDPSDVSVGMIEQQGSPSSTADVAQRHLAMIKAAVRARAAKNKKQQ
jgi:hypothetical protein